MADYCTCGAQLPENALFCHKCGKPQREIPVAIEEAAPPTPQLSPPPAPARVISLRDPAAIRAGLAAVGLMILLLLIPAVIRNGYGFLPVIGVGLIAVWFYTRRTGQRLSVSEGLRVGWIAGVLFFAIVAIMLVGVCLLMVSRGGFTEEELAAIRSQGVTQEQIDQMAALWEKPRVLAVSVGTTLLVLFMVLTALPMLGGALGAKLLQKLT